MKAGSAYIEEHPKGSGKHRVRARAEGKLITIAKGLARSDAEQTRDAYALLRHEADLREGVTLEQFGVSFLNRRELAGVRGIRTDRNYWKNHVADAPIGKLPVTTLEPADVFEWARSLRGSYRTKVKLRNLLRVALREAVELGLLKVNPAREVQIHRSGAARSTDDLEGILTPAEQERLLAAIRPGLRPVVQFALFTGLRQAEQWWLHWEDVRPDRVVVRRSVGGKAPKSGKIREVYLLPEAIAALDLMSRRGPLVFPAPRGGRRDQGKAPRGWVKWLQAAGIKRRVRWHDLRHTCATSLLAGWWGRKWSVDEVCGLLGHSSVTVTERYAKKLDETQKSAVAATPGLLPAISQRDRVTAGADSGIRTPDLRFTKALEFAALSLASTGRQLPPGSASIDEEERAFLVAVAEGLERAAAYHLAPLVIAPRKRRVAVKAVRRKTRKGVA